MDAVGLAEKFGLRGKLGRKEILPTNEEGLTLARSFVCSFIVIACEFTGKINMICISAFFRLSGVLPIDEAVFLLQESITKTYSSKGEDVVRKNHELLDGTMFIQGVK